MLRVPQNFVISLFYSSNSPQHISVLDEILKTIKSDELLSKNVHLIHTDDPYCRSLMKYNQYGIKVPDYPVFVVKFGKEETKIHPLSESVQLFSFIHEQLPSFIHEQSSATQASPPIQPSTEPKVTRKIQWSNEFFSKKKNICLRVKEGEAIQFISPQNQLHDLTEANSKWESLRRLIPRGYGLDGTLNISPDWKEHTYLICTVGENSKTMRLKLIFEKEYHQSKGDELKTNPEKKKGDELKTNPEKKKEPESEEKPKFRFSKVTVTSKPQIITMDDGTKVRIITKPKVILDESTKDHSG